MFDLRLIGAEALKLRRRTGMLALCAVLTLGVLALVYTVGAIQHATNAAEHGPAGGFMVYHDTTFLLTMLMMVVGTIVGATAGAQDLESGVFRDLAATGRSRLALFGARTPGAWAIVLPIGALGAAACAITSIALADGLPGPDAAMIVAATAGVLTAGALSAAVAVGFSALTGSKAPVIATMLALTLAVAPLLTAIGWLGDARQAIPTNALFRIGHAAGQVVEMGLVAAVIVVLAWAAAAFAAGAWRTRCREI